MRRVEGLREAGLMGLLAILLVLAFFVVNPGGLAFGLREALFDRFVALSPRSGPDMQVIAVDIDQATLEKYGAWQWPRAQMARLIEKIAEAKPRAIALDILLSGADRNGPRAIVGRIAEREKRPDLAQTAQSFPDDDAALADAMDNGVPVVLALGIATRASRENYPALVLATLKDTPVDLAPLRIAGVLGPPAQAVEAAAGLGVLSLDTDSDGWLRRIPLIFDVAENNTGKIHAGFALETVRAAEGAGTVIYDSASRSFEIGSIRFAASSDGLMRLYPRSPGYWDKRIIPAWKVLEQGVSEIGGNTIVVIGSSAPEAGAYFPGAVLGPVSTLRVQAEAIDQLRAGRSLQRLPHALWSEPAVALAAGILAVLAAIYLPPLFLVLTVVVLGAILIGGSFMLFAQGHVLADSLPSLAAIIAGAGAASVAMHNRIRSNRALVEARFARYLAPAVVEILARNPERLRIEAERREVTALFTDLEGFTSFGERTPPAQLIATLNDYFEMIAQVAVEHGGMVDKIVGDAVHVFFNMPLDQPDHAERAVRCARAIRAATETYRHHERQAALGFGRTRIGVDTGFATVGDVGGRDKLDYTAHGEAVNRAARLQSLARDFESGVLIGQGTVRKLPSMDGLVSAGQATPRGLSERQDVYTLA